MRVVRVVRVVRGGGGRVVTGGDSIQFFTTQSFAKSNVSSISYIESAEKSLWCSECTSTCIVYSYEMYNNVHVHV